MMTKKFFKMVVTMCTALFLFACSNGDVLVEQLEVAQEVPAISVDETFVSSNQAVDIANAFFTKQFGNISK